MKLAFKYLFILFFSFFAGNTVVAGFLEMPEITETPQLRGKTMVRDLDIPEVRQRNPDPSAGPRLAVSAFRIQGLVEYPELGITREAITKIVENIRADMMGEGKLLPSGYTPEEIAEVSNLLVEIEDQTKDRHVTSLEVQKLIYLVRDQRSKRGILLSQIESVADRITKFYREKGFILAKAYIPKQKVRDGIVNLTLLLGTLGEVNVKGNLIYASSTLTPVFDDMLTKPVTNNEVEENLYLINDYPGIIVDGYFEPGYQVGDTRLNINVKREDRFNANVRFDNHGTKETGKNRFYADAQVNNLFGITDLFHVSALKASSPSNTDYYKIYYQMNLFSPRWKFNASTSRNQFVVDQSGSLSSLNLNGEVLVNDVSVKYVMKRGRTSNYNIEARYDEIVSDLKLGSDDTDTYDAELANTYLLYNFDSLQEKSKILHQGSVKITSGQINFGLEKGQEARYEIFSADYTLLTFWNVFDSNTRLIFRSNAQYAGINLSSLMRFSMGGPTRARAYPSNQISADDSVYMGLDWVFNSPEFMNTTVFDTVNLKQFIKPFVFADYAYGIQNPLQDQTKQTAQLADLGVGLQFNHNNKFSGNLQFAFPMYEKLSSEDLATIDDSMRVVFDFQYSF